MPASSPGPHLMLFDLYAGGHHGQYVQQLAQYWLAADRGGRLDIVVPRYFLDRHPAVPALVAENAGCGLRVVPVEEEVHVHRPRRAHLLRADLEHGRLLRLYLDRVRPDHCLLMYFDHVQLSLALDLRLEYVVALSGIYFRPSFHYRELGGYRPTVKERLTSLRKRVLLAAAMRNRHLRHLFSLDPYAVETIEKLGRGRTKVIRVLCPFYWRLT